MGCRLAFQQLIWIIAVDALEQASILLHLLGRSIADETSQRARWAEAGIECYECAGSVCEMG